MRERWGGTGWLLVGAAAALLAWTGLADPLVGLLDQRLPSAWRRASTGVLLFAAACALYFRSHWAATLGLLTRSAPRADRAAQRVEAGADDLERTAHILTDNLIEAGRGVDQAAGNLYLTGARAHAEKLAQLALRLRGVAAQLRQGESGDPS